MIKTKGVTGSAFLKLLVRNNAQLFGTCETRAVTGTTDWERYAVSIKVPSGVTGDVVLGIRGKGTAWFDEVYVGNDDLLTNGGFDDLAWQLPSGWSPAGLGIAGITMKADTDTKHGGVASATMINSGAGGGPYGWRQEITTDLPLNKVLKLTGWVKTKEAETIGAAVAVQLLDSSDQLIDFKTTQNQQVFTGTADWKQFTLTFPVPKMTVKIAVLAMLLGRGQVWFDDFEMAVDEETLKK